MRRFASRSRRPRPPMQWVPAYDETKTLTASAIVNTVLVDAVNAATSQVPNIARMRVERIRGQIHIENGASTTAVFVCGIAVVNVNDAGTSTSLAPGLLASADYSWMWLRAFQLEPTANVGYRWNGAWPPHGADVDIKVKRVLHPQERLVLYIDNHTATNGVGNIFLRTLISRVA